MHEHFKPSTVKPLLIFVLTHIQKMSYLKFISIDPSVRFGKPCIIGTRISVGDILGWLAAGMTNEEIMADFPDIRKEHILAALEFAADRDRLTKISAA
jgi:uncharacterized protein (DUF433 family)